MAVSPQSGIIPSGLILLKSKAGLPLATCEKSCREGKDNQLDI